MSPGLYVIFINTTLQSLMRKTYLVVVEEPDVVEDVDVGDAGDVVDGAGEGVVLLK